MKIAILGCGPSGLIAAHAALQYFDGEHQINIFSIKRKSPIFGAQYLHQPIPYVPASAVGEPTVIRYEMRGTPEEYLLKVYGEKWDGTISDDLRDQAHVAWDLRGTYEWMWDVYHPLIQEVAIPSDPGYIADIIRSVSDQTDLVINTIPRPALCALRGKHEFKSTDIWAAGDSDAGPSPIPGRDNVIEYNGAESPSWYRVSRMFGFTTVEWPGHINRPPIPGTARVRKPLAHNCVCWDGLVHHLGRMGRWQNGRLAHHVYADTVELIQLAERKEIA